MKICLAQIQPERGNFALNLDKHLEFIRRAADESADLIVFPELSLTGYEPELAKRLALELADHQLTSLQQLCDEARISVCAGMPTIGEAGIQIGMLIFRPGLAREVYIKKYLHADEEPYFVGGEHYTGMLGPEENIAPAICYELSVNAHTESAAQKGAEFYLTSVAKNQKGITDASRRLAEIARQYKMTALMCNCIGPCDGFLAAGGSRHLEYQWGIDGPTQ